MTDPTGGAHRAFLATLFADVPADPAGALEHAARRARGCGFVVLPLGLQAPTEARELASVHAAIAQQSLRQGRPLAPTLILSAATVLREGRPGSAADLALALALSLDEHPAIHACTAGPAPAAVQPGLLVAPDTVRRAAARGTPAAAAWRAADAHAWFAALGDTFALVPEKTALPTVLCAVFVTQD